MVGNTCDGYNDYGYNDYGYNHYGYNHYGYNHYDSSPLHFDLSPLQKEIPRQLLDGEPTSLNPGLHENSHVVSYDESAFEHFILPFGGLGRTGHFLTATVTDHPQYLN